MERVLLNSTALSAASYDHDSAVLEIEFQRGESYRFFAVPIEDYHGLLHAESHGVYYNSHIQNRFAFVKIQAAIPASTI